MRIQFPFVVVLSFLLGATASATELKPGRVESELVPRAVEYFALLPNGYAETGTPLPLLLNLDGGGGDRGALKTLRPWIEGLWATGELPPIVVVTPTVTPHCYYLDYHDGSQKWDSFITGPFLQHIRANYKVKRDPRNTAVMGCSMGGAGALSLGLRHPNTFGTTIALEPGIMPALDWPEVPRKNRFYYTDGHFETLHGKPIDAVHWETYNPASIVTSRSAAIRDSDLRLYVECGDEDFFHFQEGAEFLHRVLQEKGIRHEYRLVLGANHVGASFKPRFNNAFRFLGRSLAPTKEDPQLKKAIEGIKALCPIPGAEDPEYVQRRLRESSGPQDD